MNKASTVSLKFAGTGRIPREDLCDKLNRRIREAIRERNEAAYNDPGIEDEYEFEIFGNAGTEGPPKKKRK